MTKVIDMTGQKFGLLTVIERGENNKNGGARWWCQCDCGSPKKLIDGAVLRRGLVVSCGCYREKKLKESNEKRFIDETGNIYGYLTVLRRAENSSKDDRTQWICRCKCGKEIIATGKSLREGSKTSCGCIKKSTGEIRVEQLLEENKIFYAEQYCIYINPKEYPYFFDFVVFNDKKEIQYLIEYDGKQHFSYTNYKTTWNTKENFERTQLRDSVKNQWCKDNNIPLIRIPYWHLKDLCIKDLKLETSNFII